MHKDCCVCTEVEAEMGEVMMGRPQETNLNHTIPYTIPTPREGRPGDRQRTADTADSHLDGRMIIDWDDSCDVGRVFRLPSKLPELGQTSSRRFRLLVIWGRELSLRARQLRSWHTMIDSLIVHEPAVWLEWPCLKL